MENIHIYRTNIYELYNLIEREYDEGDMKWYEMKDEIDIPFLISKHENLSPPLDGRNFTNIIMMFDYERQDTYFSEEKIRHLQEHFSKDSEDGILFINYPMIEAYQHFASIPDEDYINRTFPVARLKNGGYKSTVHTESYVRKYLMFYEKTAEALQSKLNTTYSELQVDEMVYRLLSLSNAESLRSDIKMILSETSMENEERNRLTSNLYFAICGMKYIENKNNFWEEIRKLFLYIAVQTILKGWKIQTQSSTSEVNDLKEKYLNMDMMKILEQQNIASQDPEKGIIWILCLCMSFMGEYKFFWKEEDEYEESWNIF